MATVTQKKVYRSIATVKAALISFKQLAACFVLCFNREEGKCLFGF